jgi:putative phage-type endonuclease
MCDTISGPQGNTSSINSEMMNMPKISKADKKRYKAQLEKLLMIPKIEQKTPEWYEARHNLITASDFAQALGEGKFGTQKQLIEKKVSTADVTKQIKNIFFEWGHMFEPLACMCYSMMMNTSVHEFGLLKHPKYDFFGASPDGITEDGVMLEIKCPLKRKITGEIPKQYYYQIQGQLDVCDLDICDYLECEFVKYNDYEQYCVEYEKTPGSYTGIIKDNQGWNFDEEKQEKYEYLSCQTRLCDKIDDSKCSYWILAKYNIKRVTRDTAFVKEKIAELKKVWDKIVYYRTHPHEFQIEVKQVVSVDTQSYSSFNDTLSEFNKRCMIIDLE